MIIYIVRSTCGNFIAACDTQEGAQTIGEDWITYSDAKGFYVTEVRYYQTK